MDSGVYKTTNQGLNWTNAGMEGKSVYALQSYGYALFAGTSNYGIFISTDEGANWNQINQGLGNNPTVTSFAIKGNYIYAALAGQTLSVWKRDISEITGMDAISEKVPTEFKLEQNYPNPFNPVTTIKYTIPTPPSSSPLAKGRNEVGFVTLKVYDVLGKEVATLVNEEKPAGNYEVMFNPESSIRYPASGIYFYQLKAGDYLETKKMILMK
ncbi:MAG: T9SS type A sorting domain-containing protein [Ignavibacteriales bacterium]|nr:T9SS type A sorting domain-containing protein [Ignavibacteriales bacterium]